MELKINMGALLTNCVYFIIAQKQRIQLVATCCFSCGKGSL